MHDPMISSWPEPTHRRLVVRAEAEDVGQGVYRLAFQDSAGKQHFIPLPSEVLQSIVESGAAVLGLSLSRQDS